MAGLSSTAPCFRPSQVGPISAPCSWGLLSARCREGASPSTQLIPELGGVGTWAGSGPWFPSRTQSTGLCSPTPRAPTPTPAGTQPRGSRWRRLALPNCRQTLWEAQLPATPPPRLESSLNGWLPPTPGVLDQAPFPGCAAPLTSALSPHEGKATRLGRKPG